MNEGPSSPIRASPPAQQFRAAPLAHLVPGILFVVHHSELSPRSAIFDLSMSRYSLTFVQRCASIDINTMYLCILVSLLTDPFYSYPIEANPIDDEKDGLDWISRRFGWLSRRPHDIMIFHCLVYILTAAWTVCALTITQPTETTGWVQTGDQLITWDVSISPLSFLIQRESHLSSPSY